MKYHFLALICLAALGLVMALATGCADDPVGSAPELVIDSVTVSSGSLRLLESWYSNVPTGKTVTINCFTNRVLTSNLWIEWTAGNGTLDRTDTTTVEWTSPDSPCTTEITVNMSDGFHNVTHTLSLATIYMVTWKNYVGTACSNAGESIVCASDGGYVVAAASGDVVLTKRDVHGNFVWTRRFGGDEIERARDLAAMPDGGYAIVGHTASFGEGEDDVYVIRTDANGDLLWEKTYGGIETDIGDGITATPDGGLAITGYSASVEGGVYLLRTDAEGNQLWERGFPGSVGKDVTCTHDGGFAITGQGGGDAFLIVTDADGNLIRRVNFEEEGTGMGFGILQTHDGGFALAGQHTLPDDGLAYGFLILTDAEGNQTQWTSFGDNSGDFVRAIAPTPDGGFVITGYAMLNAEGERDLTITRLDAAGNLLWQRLYGYGLASEGGGVICAPDNGIAVAGWTIVPGFSGGLYIVKTDPNGIVWE